MALSPTLPHQLLCDELTTRPRLAHPRKLRALLHRAGDGRPGRSHRPLAQGRSLVPAAVAIWRTTLRSRHQKRRHSRCAARCSPSDSAESDEADEEAIATGVPRLPLETWLQNPEVQLHQDLAKDIEDKFGSVPQQANEVVQDVVMRIQSGAQQCVAPTATAHPFGSTVNGFGEESSDLDVLVAIDEEELTYYMSYASFQSRCERLGSPLLSEGALSDLVQPSLLLKAVTPKIAMTHAVQQLADFLPELGFKVSQLIPRARKPLVTLEDTQSTLTEVDVSINNSLPLYNSQLLRAYSELDPRVRPLVLLVKVWAKGKKVCGAQGGNLSSYSWTIMVLYFLQLVGLLPSLQLLSKEERMLETRDYWGNERSFQVGFLTAEEYQKDVADGKIAAPTGEAGLSLAELFYGFIHFYSKEYNWGSEAWASDRRAELPLPAAASGRSGPNNPCYRFDSRAMGQPLVKATAKATAFCSAQLFANVAPKLHNDMRASMDNAVHANLRVNPVAKAFCDSYLSASSDDHSLTANVQVLSGGSVSAVVIAVVLTGQLWPLLLFMLLLVAGIGVGIVWALRALQVRTPPEIAKAVVQDLLKVDLEQYNKDSSVQGIIDYVVSYPRFVHEYRKLTYNMPSDKILQRVAGEELPANLQGKSIRELAQRLRDRLQDESKKWCKSYRCINKFLTTGVQRANDLVVMQQITQGWSGRSAVDESKMKKALKLDDLEEAVKVLAEPRQDLIKEARTLLHNIHLSNPDFHTVYSEMESLAEASRHRAQNALRLQQLQKAKGGVQEHLEY
eukprot:s5168_g5.t3